MCPRYVLQLLFSEKSQDCSKTQPPLKLENNINTVLESIEFYNFSDVCLTKFKNNQILLYKISYRFQLTTKPIIR